MLSGLVRPSHQKISTAWRWVGTPRTQACFACRGLLLAFLRSAVRRAIDPQHPPCLLFVLHTLQAPPRKTPSTPAGGMFSGPARMMRRALEASGGCVPSAKDVSPVRRRDCKIQPHTRAVDKKRSPASCWPQSYGTVARRCWFNQRKRGEGQRRVSSPVLF